MARVNPRQVSAGGNFTTLNDFLDKRWVTPIPFVETQVVTCAAENYKLIDSSILVGNIAKDTTSTYSGGVVAAGLVGAVGTAATTTIADSLGNIANIVEIRDALTHDEIQLPAYDDRQVFGLIQCSNTVTDGDAIGAAASENLQISFVYIASDGTITLTAVTANVEFAINKMITEENLPTYQVAGGAQRPDVIDPTATQIKIAKYDVTTAFAANEVITLTTGAGATTGVATPSGDYAAVALGASANAMRDNNQVQILQNGVVQVKSTDFVWDSATTGHFAIALDIGDHFEVEYFA